MVSYFSRIIEFSTNLKSLDSFELIQINQMEIMRDYSAHRTILSGFLPSPSKWLGQIPGWHPMPKQGIRSMKAWRGGAGGGLVGSG
jgi:hypothetical protein